MQLKKSWTSFGPGLLKKLMRRLLLGNFYIKMLLMKEMRGTSQVLGTQHGRMKNCICA